MDLDVSSSSANEPVASEPSRPVKPRRTITIKLAQMDDVDRIVLTMSAAHAESERELEPIDRLYARNWCTRILAYNMTWLAVDGNSVVGVLMLAPITKNWSPKTTTFENMHFYVSKPYRASGLAVRLIDRAKLLADATNMALQISVSYGVAPEAKDRFIRFQGFDYLGGNHLYTPGKT